MSIADISDERLGGGRGPERTPPHDFLAEQLEIFRQPDRAAAVTVPAHSIKVQCVMRRLIALFGYTHFVQL